MEQPPTADAGEELTIDATRRVTLDGSGSSNPDGTSLAYSWQQIDGEPTIELDRTRDARITFYSPAVTQDTVLTFRLTVTNRDGLTDTDTVRVVVLNTRPFANAGADRAANAEQAVTLDGSNSHDLGNGTVTYRWRQVGGEPTVTLTDADTAHPVFTAPTVTGDNTTTLTFELTVTDAGGLADTSTVAVAVSNMEPFADTGDDRTATAGQTVTLGELSSRDSGDGTVTYRWRQVGGEPTVTLVDANVAHLVFTVPDVTQDTTFIFELTVTDADDIADSATVQVAVPNPAPIADAGSDHTAGMGRPVTLDGSGSNDSGGSVLRYAWTSPPGVTLIGDDTATPSFTTPTAAATLGLTLTFELTVTDQGGQIAKDSVFVRVAGNTEVFAIDDHDGPVRSVSVSDGGNLAVSGGTDGTVRLWNAPVGEEIRFDGGARSLGNHDGAVYAVAISGDGSRAISGGFDGAVHLWNTATGERIRSLRSSGMWVYAVALDEDGSHAVAGGFDGKVRFWNTATGREMRSPGTHGIDGVPTSVYAVALSRNGHRALSGGADGTVRLWDTNASGSPVRRFDGYSATGSILAVALSGDGKIAVAGDGGNRMRVWDTANGRKLYELSGHRGDVSSVSINVAKTRVLSAGGDGTVRLWNVDTSDSADDRAIRTVRLHTDYVWSAGMSNGGLVLSGGADGLVNAWDAAAPPPDITESFQSSVPDARPGWQPGDVTLRYLYGTLNPASRVSLSADGRRALSGHGDELDLWNTGDGRHLHTMTGHEGDIRDVSLNQDGSLALSGSNDDTVRLWDTTTGNVVQTMRGHSADVRNVSLSADGSLALSGGYDDTVRLWDANTGNLLRTMTGHGGAASGVALSVDGRIALSGSRTHTVRLWDAANGNPLRTMAGHTNGLYSVALSADGRLALSGSSDDTVRLWDTTSGKLLRTMTGHAETVRDVALSADGRLAMSGSADGTARLWDATTGDLMRIMRDGSGEVRSVALSADGRLGLSGTGSRPHLWHIERSHARSMPSVATAAASHRRDRPRSASVGPVVTLDGSGSTDARAANGKPVAYYWRQTGGLPVTLSTTDAETTTFTAPSSISNEPFTFVLTVTDSDGFTARDSVTINADAGVDLLTKQDHDGAVRGVSISRAGDLAVSGGIDGTVRLWNANTGEAIRTLGSHHGAVYAVAINADGTHAISGGADGTVRLWTWNETGGGEVVRYGSATRSLGQKGIWVYAVALNKDGSRAASGGFDGKVRVWNTAQRGANAGGEITYAASGGKRRSLGTHTTAYDNGTPTDTSDDIHVPTSVYGVSLSDDGKRLLSGGADGTVRLWNTDTGNQVRTLADDGPMGVVFGVALSGDGTVAASANADDQIHVWNAGTGAELHELSGHLADVSSVSLNEDGTRVLSASGDGTVRLWNVDRRDSANNGTRIRTWYHHTNYAWSASLSGDGRVALSGGSDGRLNLWNTATNTASTTETLAWRQRLESEPNIDLNQLGDVTSQELTGAASPVTRVSLSADGRRALSGHTDDHLRLWNVSDGSRLRSITGHSGNIRDVSLNWNGSLALSGSNDRTVRLWDADSGRVRHTMRGHTAEVRNVLLSAGGNVVLSGGQDGTMRVWNANNGILLHTISGHGGTVSGVSLSADGRLALSGNRSHTVLLWRTDTGKLLHTMTGHTKWVLDVAMSAGGRLALSGGDDRTVRLWDTATGRPLHIMHGHTGSVRDVALSADGRLALSVSTDRTMRLWDTTTGQTMRIMRGHADEVHGVALSADGRLAMSGAHANTNNLRLWRIGRSHGESILSAQDSLTDADTIRRVVPNPAPIAEAGDARSVDVGERVILNGSASRDPGGETITYRWRQVEGEPTLRLASADAARPAFTAPHVTETTIFTFELTVTDKTGFTDVDTVRVTVSNPATEGAVIANAGEDQTVNGGSTVVLDGSGSIDEEAGNGKPSAYSWRQTSGGDVRLSAADTVRATFTAPGSPPRGTSVGDAAKTATNVAVTVVSGAACGFVKVFFFLLGDRNKNCQPSGPVFDINSTVTDTDTFTFELTVTGTRGRRHTDTVTITVRRAESDSAPPPSIATGTSPRPIMTLNASPSTHAASPTRTGLRPGPAMASDTTVAANTACASTVDKAGRTMRGRVHGGPSRQDCIYPASFLNADNPLVADMTIVALPNDGAHIFQGSLVVGRGRNADATIAQEGHGPTLTIEPGAILAFEQPPHSLIVNQGARLLAVGTPDKPITLTSYNNTQGAATPPQGTAYPGAEVLGNPVTRTWLGLNIRGNGSDGKDSGHLEYLVVKHAGTSDTGGIELHDVGSTTTVRNLQAYASHGDGLTLIGGDVHVENFVAVYAQGDSIDIGGGWSGTLTNALAIQSEHGGDHCLNIHGPGQESTGDPTSGRITGLTCITSSHTAGAENLGAGIRLGADATPTIERSLVVGVFADDTDPRANYCLRIDNHPAQTVDDEPPAPTAATFTGNVFACEDKTGKSTVEAWLASGNNQFADVTAPTDPTTATDTHLQLLGGTPPVYSLHYNELQVDGTDTTVTPPMPNGPDFPGAASQSAAPSWLRPDGIDWTHGIFEGSRDEPLWFEPAP